MIYLKLMLTIYLYFMAFCVIGYISKKIVEIIEHIYKRKNRRLKNGNKQNKRIYKKQ